MNDRELENLRSDVFVLGSIISVLEGSNVVSAPGMAYAQQIIELAQIASHDLVLLYDKRAAEIARQSKEGKDNG